MKGKIIASYLIKVVLREPEGIGADEQTYPAPTLPTIEHGVLTGIDTLTPGIEEIGVPRRYVATATAERTDI